MLYQKGEVDITGVFFFFLVKKTKKKPSAPDMQSWFAKLMSRSGVDLHVT